MARCSKELNVEDYRIFSMAVSQRYISPVKEEDQKEVREAVVKFHDRMFDTFQNMPPKIVLVMRNINTVRSIVTLHKSGVDRFRAMARIAVSGRYSGGIRGFLARVLFELRLA